MHVETVQHTRVSAAVHINRTYKQHWCVWLEGVLRIYLTTIADLKGVIQCDLVTRSSLNLLWRKTNRGTNIKRLSQVIVGVITLVQYLCLGCQGTS